MVGKSAVRQDLADRLDPVHLAVWVAPGLALERLHPIWDGVRHSDIPPGGRGVPGVDHSAVVATDLDASSAFYHMLGLERIDALLNEAGLLQWTAQNRLAAGDVAEASRMLEQARLLAEDAATYVLPSGMHLAVRALLTALDRQLMSLSAIPRRGCT